MTDLQRRLDFYPAGRDTEYKRGDPRWRGVWSAVLAMYVIGPDGAAQFKVFTGWDLPEVVADANPGIEYPSMALIRQPTPADLGYHRRTPAYEGQGVMGDDCHLIGGPCYYDGSGLAADGMFGLLVREGSEAVWAALEEYYRDRVLSPTEAIA